MMQVYNQGSASSCLCGEHPETVEHIVSGCLKLAGQQYKARHDHIARYLHIRSAMLSVAFSGGNILQQMQLCEKKDFNIFSD